MATQRRSPSLSGPDPGKVSPRNTELPPPNGNASEKKTPGIRPAGESGRSGIHPLHFLAICFRSSNKVSASVNILWPLVPVAIALRYALTDTVPHHLVIFITSYLAMVPCANLIGFAGQELARKVPHVFGVLIETT